MMKNLRVLIVEDDEGLAFVIQERLKSKGYEVRSARGSEEGYATFLSFRPDLVITDIMIGEEDGLRLMSLIRNFAPNIKTIYISGELNRFRSALEREKKLHRVSFLEKPFAGADLMRLVYAQQNGWKQRAV